MNHDHLPWEYQRGLEVSGGNRRIGCPRDKEIGLGRSDIDSILRCGDLGREGQGRGQDSEDPWFGALVVENLSEEPRDWKAWVPSGWGQHGHSSLGQSGGQCGPRQHQSCGSLCLLFFCSWSAHGDRGRLYHGCLCEQKKRNGQQSQVCGGNHDHLEDTATWWRYKY